MTPPIIAAVLVAVAIIIIFWAISSPRGDQGMGDRLGRYVKPEAKPEADAPGTDGSKVREQIASTKAFSDFNRFVEKRDFGAGLSRELARADLTLKPGEFVALRIGVLLGVPSLFYLLGQSLFPSLGNPVAWLVGAAIGWWIPGVWLGRRKGRRLKAFNAALADTITLIANALRSGSSFLQAVEMVVRESDPPMSTEFGRVVREVNLGLPFEQALNNMVRRVKSDDLELMTTAISIQYQVGGNLAEILDSIAFTIRERVRIKGEIRTLTAQQRMSGYVVAGLPLGLMGILSLIAPNFMAPMFAPDPKVFGLPLGVVILGFGGVLMLIGFTIIRKIVDIKV